ncbi:MAG: thioredoxin family protein [Desulfovibrio sp.]|nr:thioredoxin family protein [Desulfovibrio sp.]
MHSDVFLPRIKVVALFSFLFVAGLVCTARAAQTDIPVVPVKGKVTMLDLGATACIPCKMMAPIMRELKKEYADRAAIIFIDVWKNPDVPEKFNIDTIPTQIFYDANGQEQYRHVGFFDKASIVAKLVELGVN